MVEADDRATEVFVRHRELLFSVVYSQLGSIADTEDVLQETWIAWSGVDQAHVVNARAYLVRVAVNQAVTRRRRINRNREVYVGPWLPEPVVEGDEPEDGAERVERGEEVSIALMVVLETLSPLERVVFVLHEIFAYNLVEIAEILDKKPTAVRQLAHRARSHVQARRGRFLPDPRARREATERFLDAALGGDVGKLMDVLAPEVTLWSDGGGVVPAARRLVHGRDKVARLIAAVAEKHPQGLRVDYRSVNGDPAALLFVGEDSYAVVHVELDAASGQVAAVHVLTNPEKLTRVAG
ncbi:RNA polymerase sigma factor SigJ [Streptomyces iconiensis]|uniref:RNA polymerase sigma factor SigJ n=1 Tax=Streptomyces iconiensis TaxID=1384038 RepID=A0ABT6ZSC0_9ACTN|nr:RNA polymerase sigma factor SigJ [Streptomyces iconiensis]MDJ1131531.1 RNA polymerase sigma factor SigJ [Streptomyces iconiensis]